MVSTRVRAQLTALGVVVSTRLYCGRILPGGTSAIKSEQGAFPWSEEQTTEGGFGKKDLLNFYCRLHRRGLHKAKQLILQYRRKPDLPV